MDVLQGLWNLAKAAYAFVPKIVAVVLCGLLAAWLCLALGKASAANDRAERLATDRDAWKANAQGWEASYRASEKNRAAEGHTAREASTAASLACDARVATARRSAAAIRSITQAEVPTDANHCPVRPLVPVERLRNALAPADAPR